jgi:hypothetical protein
MLVGCLKLATFSTVTLPHLVGALLVLARSGSAVETDEVTPAVVDAPPSVAVHDAPRTSHRFEELQHARPARTLTMRLEAGEPVPYGRPNTWVHIPEKQGGLSELRLTFVFHGFKNCIESYTGAGSQCTAANIMRPGYQIAMQLESADARSIVVVPETSFDIASAEAPTLAKHGAFRAYVDELLSALSDDTGGAHIEDVRRLALVASSGGYQALEPILQDSASLVTDVLLLDAGYMYPNSAVGRFLGVCAADLADGSPAHHAGILYTPSGGARPTSEELVRFTARRLDRLGALARARFGHLHRDPSDAELASPLYMLRVDEEHDVVVRRNLGRVIAAAGL